MASEHKAIHIQGNRLANKLLILSDIHYPIGRLALIKSIVTREKPDNIALLGDNIELSMFKNHVKAYENFYKGLDAIFPIRKSIIMVGDNDYQYSGDRNIAEIITSYSPINHKDGELISFKKGSMHFFHGNVEKSHITERLGYMFVKTANRINYGIAPRLLASIVRDRLHINREDYLFLGHLHCLSIKEKDIFCGTLNYKFMPFPNSLGYVTLMHEGFRPSSKSIKAVRL